MTEGRFRRPTRTPDDKPGITRTLRRQRFCPSQSLSDVIAQVPGSQGAGPLG